MSTTLQVPEASQRDLLRAQILASKTPKSKVITFFGGQIEIRQPKLSDILEARAETDQNARVINILLMYAYVPGTSQKVFEEGDKAALLEMPFGGDFIAVTDALEELSSVNFLEQKSKSGQTGSDSSSSGSPGNLESPKTTS